MFIIQSITNTFTQSHIQAFLSLFLRHLYLVEAVIFVKLIEVNIAGDAFDAACLGMLPESEAGGGIAAVVGDEDVVVLVFLAAEMLPVDLLAGVDKRLHAVLQLHEFENLVDTGDIKVPSVALLDVENRDEILLGFLHHLLEVAELLVGGGLLAVEMITSHKDASGTGAVDIALVHRVLDGCAFGGFDVGELDLAGGFHLAPVDNTLELRNVYTLGRGGIAASDKEQKGHQGDDERGSISTSTPHSYLQNDSRADSSVSRLSRQSNVCNGASSAYAHSEVLW